MTKNCSKKLVEFNLEPERMILRRQKKDKHKVESSSPGFREELPKEEMEGNQNDNQGRDKNLEDPIGDLPQLNSLVDNRGGRTHDPLRKKSDFSTKLVGNYIKHSSTPS